MSELQFMKYTKKDGETSKRAVILVSRPRKNYLMYDVSALSDEARSALLLALEKTEEFRENAMADFEMYTGIDEGKLWRSFKPEGVAWEE